MFLGIDLGTSSLKALLIDGQDRILAQASAPLEVASPRPSWSEQDPQGWWDACVRSVLALPANLRREVSGIGLSGQMHGAVLLDTQDAVLRPAILWNDGRSAAECTELERREPRVREITGNLPMAGFTAPKLMWVHRHEPEVFRATRIVLLPKDYLRLRLTGAKVSDFSDASGTLWLDVAQRAWSEELLSACDLQRGHMPSLVEGDEPSATLCADVAQLLGMPPSVVVAGGAGDNAASAIGTGVIDAGQAFLSVGTFWGVVRRDGHISTIAGQGRARIPPRAAGPLAPNVRDVDRLQRPRLGRQPAGIRGSKLRRGSRGKPWPTRGYPIVLALSPR